MSSTVLSFLVLLSWLLLDRIGVADGFVLIEERDLSSEESLRGLYERWRGYHSIDRDGDELQKRFNVFKHNVQFIHNFNKNGASYKLKLNEFGDLTHQEFRSYYANSMIDHHRMLRGSPAGTDKHVGSSNPPASIDWRELGAVADIKNQGQCGSCWSFSTNAAIEGITAIKTNKLISLSEQELVDCDIKTNKGCEGGMMGDAFEFVIKNGGIVSQEKYPYKAKQGHCNTSMLGVHDASIDGYVNVPVNSEKALMAAVAQQPVSVGIEASGADFQFYSEGVFTGDCGTELNHGVAAVGYGTDTNGTKYWIVKNSWGKTWGENGYIRMQRDVTQAEGLCGIASYAVYPTIKDHASQNAKDEL